MNLQITANICISLSRQSRVEISIHLPMFIFTRSSLTQLPSYFSNDFIDRQKKLSGIHRERTIIWCDFQLRAKGVILTIMSKIITLFLRFFIIIWHETVSLYISVFMFIIELTSNFVMKLYFLDKIYFLFCVKKVIKFTSFKFVKICNNLQDNVTFITEITYPDRFQDK